MSETDTSMIEDLPDEVPTDDPVRNEQPQFWALVILGAAALTVSLYLLLSPHKSSGFGMTAENEQAELAYSDILEEMRTGVRLARLDDFITEYPDSPQILAVRAQRAALKKHEELAWSKVTDSIFEVEPDTEKKQKTIDAYKSNWGTLFRAQQLELLTGENVEDRERGFKYVGKKSRFAKGGDARALVGAPQIKQSPPRVNMSRRAGKRTPHIVEARIRSKKTPVYPSNAKRRRIPATITLSLDIDRRGRVVDTRVLSVEARRYKKDFIRAAERAAKRTRFYPKKIGGKSVPTRGYVQRYSFRVSR